ncbi:Methyl-CpG-binding domain-containing protein 7 [Linum perenne]
MTLNITVKTPSLNYPTPQNPERKIPSQSAMERPSSSRISVQIPKLSSDSSSNSMQLQFQAHDLSALSQIVPLDQIICSTPASASSPDGFQLPEGWIVQKRRRRLPSFGGSPVFDKFICYCVARSCIACMVNAGSKIENWYVPCGSITLSQGAEGNSVRSYLFRDTSRKGENVKLSPRWLNGQDMKRTMWMQVVASEYESGSQLGLPFGWLVELRPRSDRSKFDKYYIEPHTGRRFRSLPDVHRYLKEDEGYVGTPMAIKSRHDQNNMQVVPSAYDDGSQLGLPLGWFVELRPRSDPSKFDKYYIEPQTGRRFRSIPDVQRYLERDPATPIAIKSRHDQSNMQTVPSAFKSGSQFNLPCDWLVELRPRSDGSRLDRYYIEPGTGRKFRSLVAAQKQVEEAEELRTGLKASTPMVYTTRNEVTGKVKKFKRLADVGETSTLTQHGHSSNESLVDIEETRTVKPSHCRSATRIKWVFNGQCDNMWSPSIDGSPVPESEVRGWSEAFVLSMDSMT